MDLTRILNDYLSKSYLSNGVLVVFTSHTTCSIATANLDPGTDLDMIDAFTEMFPKLTYRHQHDPAHVGDHIMTSMLGCSLTIPVQSATMVLGTWQKVVLVEFAGPRERFLNLTFIPEKR